MPYLSLTSIPMPIFNFGIMLETFCNPCLKKLRILRVLINLPSDDDITNRNKYQKKDKAI